MPPHTPQPFTFKTVAGVDYKLDCFLPDVHKFGSATKARLPVLVNWHGGGLVAGTRAMDDLSLWLLEDSLQAGFVFISPDYTLLAPHTAHDIISDVKDVISWIAARLNQEVHSHTVDPRRIAVSGNSAGGYLAYLAALYASPKPRVMVPIYAMGGNMLVDACVVPKSEPFIRDGDEMVPLLPQEPYISLLEADRSVPPCVWVDNNPELARDSVYVYLLQAALLVDVVAGIPGISAKLASVPLEERAVLIPKDALPLFPHLAAKNSMPPAFFVHGTADSIVSIDETRTMHQLLVRDNIDTVFLELDGKEHAFDLGVTSSSTLGLDGVVPFLLKHL
ncbi:Alpha/Beta hydrolase protein [Mycena maculata]|uniref:Alpha/Beta hydrolase protein n=1 Tax=Mycena maculata TaxID=230809 RepID=A0AAD7K1R2_9AGAR|nr:Alpha/Beta hydrolase protein [Mycena maculata]